MSHTILHLEELIETVRTLRSERGCPWDRKQTSKSMVKYLKEEVEELIEAIESDDTVNLCEEIGDVLFILVMISEMHDEKNLFSFDQSIQEINRKLIRRHPHVFEGVQVDSEEELREQWQKIKENEKKRD